MSVSSEVMARLPMHAYHPLMVHFPLVAVVLAAGGDLWHWARNAPHARGFATLLWQVALVGALASVGSGLLAFNAVEHSDAGHALMTVHRNAALAVTVALLTIVLLRHRTKWTPARWLGLAALGGIIVVGDLGADLVYVHLMGIPTARLHAVFVERGGRDSVLMTAPPAPHDSAAAQTEAAGPHPADGHTHRHAH